MIGNHSYSHKYEIIYRDVDSFLVDFSKTNDLLSKVLDGYTTDVIRFPGGSTYKNRKPCKDAAIKAGYQIYDWNVLIGDADSKIKTIDEMKALFFETLKGKNTAIILMHDFDHAQRTVEILPWIIGQLRENGYAFGVLGRDDLYY